MHLFRTFFASFLLFVFASAELASPLDEGRKTVRDKIMNRAARGRAGQFSHLVGMKGDAAAAAIKKEHPELIVHTLPEGSMVTMDMRPDRVRIFVNQEGVVAAPPRIG